MNPRFALFLAWTNLAACCAQDVVSTNPQDAALAGVDAVVVVNPDATTTSHPDATVIFDAQMTVDSGTPDSGAMLACHVDRFSVCDDPDEAMRTNEMQSDAFNRNSSSNGCQSGDSFTPGGLMLSSVMCPREMADWYSTTFVPCNTITFVAEVRLHPLTPCEPGALELQVLGQVCTDPDVECETVGSDQVIRFLVPPGNSVGSFKFGVLRVATNVKIDYELSYAIRR